MAADSDVAALLLMGRIWRAHGLKGEVKVIPETDEPERFQDLDVVYVGRTPSAAQARSVEKVRYQPSKKGTLIILKLSEAETREDAELLKRTSVYARPDDLPPLGQDEFFLHDLIGLRAVRENGPEIGIVENVVDLPGQEVLVIARSDRSPALVPAVPEFVVDIDVEAGQLVIRPIEGLLDE